ncbi:cytochrome ubiquinol oxidase subunit I [uncultured Bacteroides sp.]|jgi:cytochrome d ubiquinol oxidase subunit I|uniref:cytochrome ubiquinol oxidase subunit I n=1 Tax=uncultured Bacteroides sp. TaxID=162156 RepID=UPI0025F58511|nr:cytochrome ubiquinol oxidase subunit I [uncultured Bacteroides sp.]
MIESIDTSLIDWSRAQFAMTAMYHWIFVPLTLGLAVVMGIMETLYYRTGNEFWKRTAMFWMRLFGINFAIGVATGLILEFEFGTNWSNYSWFVGDIFGAPLAIEGILAFFMEATFIAVMFFGWEKVSKRFHLVSTWLTGLGATISAWWILVANAWMQHPVGMEFNPDTVRNEMVDFWAVATSPVAVNKFCHTVLSGWVLGAIFVVGVSCWYLLKKRHREFALSSIKIAAVFGLGASLLSAFTGDGSGYHIAQTQPMKLAAVEGLYEGGKDVGLVCVGMLNPEKETYNDGKEPFLFRMEIPGMLSILAERDREGYVPGISNLIEGGYQLKDGTTALSAAEKIERGKTAIQALAAYRAAKSVDNEADAAVAYKVLQENMPYFGYGYIKDVNELVPNVPLNFYAFRVMVMLGGYFILFFIVVLFLAYKQKLAEIRWMHWLALLTIPLGYIAGQAGWIVAECGRQPWAIQDMLPTTAAISNLDTGSVQTTFFIFLCLFTVMLIAGTGIMLKSIRKGPDFE